MAKREYLNEVASFWDYQNRKTKEGNNTSEGLFNILKGYRVMDNALKSNEMARHGFDMAKLYADPTNVDVVGKKAIESLFTPEQIASMATSEAPKSGLLSSMKQTFMPDPNVTNLATVGQTASSAGATVGSGATGASSATAGGATAGASANPIALAVMAMIALGTGASRKGTTLNRWNNKAKGWFK